MVYMYAKVRASNASICANYEFICYTNYGVRPSSVQMRVQHVQNVML